jgi:hypothetical protein
MESSIELYYSLYNTTGNHFLNTSLDLFIECSIEVVSLEDSINYSIEIQYYNCIERSAPLPSLETQDRVFSHPPCLTQNASERPLPASYHPSTFNLSDGRPLCLQPQPHSLVMQEGGLHLPTTILSISI